MNDPLPPISDPEPEAPLHPLAPAVQTVWRLKLALFWGFLLLVALTVDGVSLLRGGDGLFVPGFVSLAVLVAGTLLTLYVPRLRYRTWRYALSPEELYLERGIYNRVRTIVPLRRIQHLDVTQDLFEREFELAKLIVHTAGTRSSDVVLPGLRIDEAESLRDRVRAYILEDVTSEAS